MIQYGPIKLDSSWTGKVIKASDKETLPVYWQGNNATEMMFTGTLVNDYFARQNFLIRLPKIVRLFQIAGGAMTPDFLSGVASITSGAANATTKLAVAYTTYDGTGGSSSIDFDRWIRCAIPNPGSTDYTTGGYCLTIIACFAPLIYGSTAPAFDIVAEAQADYNEYVSKRANFARHEIHFYQDLNAGFDGVLHDVAQEIVAGDGVYGAMGPALSTLGWTFHSFDSGISLIDIPPWTEWLGLVQNFFDL